MFIGLVWLLVYKIRQPNPNPSPNSNLSYDSFFLKVNNKFGQAEKSTSIVGLHVTQ
jgi:hypothetical protein